MEMGMVIAINLALPSFFLALWLCRSRPWLSDRYRRFPFSIFSIPFPMISLSTLFAQSGSGNLLPICSLSPTYSREYIHRETAIEQRMMINSKSFDNFNDSTIRSQPEL